ncbi:uncharacterized protein DS421_1g22670 [Arachis hypogaea]|nr:uncharacterized protein DS421_1g22670 [Arachis hypogaea]
MSHTSLSSLTDKIQNLRFIFVEAMISQWLCLLVLQINGVCSGIKSCNRVIVFIILNGCIAVLFP